MPRTPAAAAKSSKSEADPEITGRRKHLGRLVEVFAENEATWDDFGSFLDFMSRKVTPCRRDYLKRYNPVIQNCRHSPEMDRGHYGWLAEKDIDFFNKKLLPKDGSFTNHCMTMGSAEKKKTPGFVVDDVCSNAREFLKALRQGNVVLGSTEGSQRGAASVPGEVVQYTANPASPVKAGSSGRRLSTKMRVAVLAYLQRFTHDSRQLRDEVFGFLGGCDLQVLHLCGCGVRDADGSFNGCTEPSHLILGTQSLNNLHYKYHGLIEMTETPADYQSAMKLFQTSDRLGLGYSRAERTVFWWENCETTKIPW